MKLDEQCAFMLPFCYAPDMATTTQLVDASTLDEIREVFGL